MSAATAFPVEARPIGLLPPLRAVVRPVRTDPVARALADAELLRGLDAGVIDALLPSFTVQSPERGAVVYQAGDASDRIYIVLSGTVKVGVCGPSGQERLLRLVGRGDHFGELAVFDTAARMGSATVVADAVLASVSYDAFERWVSTHVTAAVQVLRVVTGRLRQARATVADATLVDAPGRTAKLLLELADSFGVRQGSTVRVDHELTQQELAQLVGAARETVNKALSTFCARGWIQVEPGSVVILDADRLGRRAR